MTATRATAECPHVYDDLNDLTPLSASTQVGVGQTETTSASLVIGPTQRGSFSAVASKEHVASGTVATTVHSANVADTLSTYRIEAHLHVPDGADPNACARVFSDPNNGWGFSFTYRQVILAPATMDFTVSAVITLYTRGGAGTLSADFVDLTSNDLNGPPLMVVKQATYTVTKGDQVPLDQLIQSLSYDITLTGPGTVDAALQLDVQAEDDDCDSSGGGGSGNGDEVNSDVEPDCGGCPPEICGPDDDGGGSDDPNDSGGDGPGGCEDDCCEESHSPPANPAPPTNPGIGMHMSLESGRMASDLPVVDLWAAGRKSLQLKLMHRDVGGRFFRANYEYELVSSCTYYSSDPPPTYVDVYVPHDHRYTNQGTRAPSFSFKWVNGKYELQGNAQLEMSYAWDSVAGEAVFTMSHLSGREFIFRRSPCVDQQGVINGKAYLTEVRDRQGRITRITHDGYMLDTITDPWGRTIEFEAAGTSSTDNIIAYYASVTHPTASNTTPTGTMTTTSVPSGSSDIYALDHIDTYSITDAVGGIAKYRFMPNLGGKLLGEQRRNGNLYSADSNSDFIQIFAHPNSADPNNPIDFDDPNDWGPTETVLKADHETTWEITRTCPLNGPCVLSYSPGWIDYEDGEGRVVQYFRDEHGFITQVRMPVTGSPTTNIVVWRAEYNKQKSRPTRIYDSNLGAWKYAWNSNRLMAHRYLPGSDPNQPGSQSWYFEYNEDYPNKLERKTKPNGDYWEFTYYDPDDANNRQGLLKTRRDPENRITSFDYGYYAADVAPGTSSVPLPGRMQFKEQTDPDGVVTRWEYSALGELTSVVQTKNSDEISRVEFSDYTPIGLPQTRTVYRDTNETVVTTFEYDLLGRLTKQAIDPNDLNYVWNYEYDGEGYLTKVTDPEGLERTYDYDYRNRLKSVTLDGGAGLIRDVVFDYDRSDRLQKITDPKGQETTFDYDAERGQLTKITDREGYETSIAYYDFAGRSLKGGRNLVDSISRTIDPNQPGRIFNVKYDFYDQFLRPISRTVDPNGVALNSRWEYNNDGSCGCSSGSPGSMAVHRVQDPTGGVSYLHYDKRNRPTKVVRKVGDTADNGGDTDDAITTLAYDQVGLLTKVVDPDGVMLTRNFDWQNRQIIQTLDPNGVDLQSVYGFDMAGNLTSVTNPAGNVYDLNYDAADRLTSIIDGDSVMSATYDKIGRMMSYTRDDSVWSVQRNGLGQVTKLYDPIVETPDDKFAAFLYDLNGNVTQRTDNEGRITSFAYDDLDRRYEVTRDVNDIAAQTTVTYNGLNQVRTLCDTACDITSYDYDVLGRLTTIEFPDSDTVDFDFSTWVSDRRISRTDQNGATTTYAFNDLYQLTNRGTSTSDPNDIFTWTKAGRLLSAYQNSGGPSSEFTWDTAGRIDTSKQTIPSLGTTSFDLDLSYTVNGMTGVDERIATYPHATNRIATGRSITHAWDDRGRLSTITDSVLGGVLANTYDDGDNLLLESIGSGVVQQGYGYDNADRLSYIVGVTPGSPDVYHVERTIGHDAAGNRSFVRNLIGGHDDRSELYGYDGLDRLRGVERGELNGAGDAITDPPPAGMLAAEDWTNLDANGNWLSWSWDRQLPGGGTDTFSETRTHDSDGANELITRYPSNGPQVALSYDYAGNLTDDGAFTYTYDAHHRLKTVSENMTVRLRIDYDALGRVIRRQLGDSGPETFYVYDAPTPGGPNGYAVVQERDDSGDLLREFIHRAGHLRPVAMVDYTAAGSIGDGDPETFYYVYDERGSVATITDAAGAVVESYDYDAYGGATVYDDTGAVVARWNDPNDWDDHALTPSTVGNPLRLHRPSLQRRRFVRNAVPRLLTLPRPLAPARPPRLRRRRQSLSVRHVQPLQLVRSLRAGLHDVPPGRAK